MIIDTTNSKYKGMIIDTTNSEYKGMIIEQPLYLFGFRNACTYICIFSVQHCTYVWYITSTFVQYNGYLIHLRILTLIVLVDYCYRLPMYNDF